MMAAILCAQCKMVDIVDRTVYYGRDNEMLGHWPRYYFGAGPYEPHFAEVYFCGPHCANAYHQEHLNAEKRTNE